MSYITYNKADVEFDGHELSHYFVINNISRPLMGSPSITTVDIEGRNGTSITGWRMKEYDVGVTVTSIQENPEDMREAFLTLAGWLNVDETPRILKFSDENGRYRLVVPSNASDITNYGLDAGMAEITFTVPDGCQFGREWTYTSTSGICEMEIKGTIAAPLIIKSTSASGTFSLMDDSGNMMRIEIGSTAKALSIDTDVATVTVGGNRSMITLDSVWLILAPGKHTITRTAGSGEFTVSYTERWAG